MYWAKFEGKLFFDAECTWPDRFYRHYLLRHKFTPLFLQCQEILISNFMFVIAVMLSHLNITSNTRVLFGRRVSGRVDTSGINRHCYVWVPSWTTDVIFIDLLSLCPYLSSVQYFLNRHRLARSHNLRQCTALINWS